MNNILNLIVALLKTNTFNLILNTFNLTTIIIKVYGFILIIHLI